jgi:acyl-CoA dehydrogenase
MILLQPKQHDRKYPDERSREVMLKTIEFFERKGKRRLKEDDHAAVWYADFLDFVRKERIFATMCTPAGYGADDCRWDTWRICEFAEILGFYGLQYWYTWQVSVLGLGPIWMSANEERKRETARLLEEGAIFAFGLSEKAHGADLYSTEMALEQVEGGYRANGRKYYIGNGNLAARVSTFGKLTNSGDYCFFAADSQHANYECVQNVCHSQNFVSEYALHNYPVREEDILSRGDEAWNTALNTVNIGIRGHPPRRAPHALRHAGDGLPAREGALHRRLLPPGGHEAGGVARRRLHALGLGGRPPLPALQPGGEDEGDDPRRGRDQPHVGRDRRQGLREGHLLRDGRARHPGPAEAGRHGARQHRADREVHGELLLPAGGVAPDPAPR